MDELFAYSERRRASSDRRLPGRALRGGRRARGCRRPELAIRAAVTIAGDERRHRLRRHRTAARREPELPARGHALGLLLRRALPDRPGPPRLGRRVRARVRCARPRARLVNARPPAAVAAGNVETSSRIVDVLFAAFGQAVAVPAQGQGTMNNLTLGNDRFTYYETIGGGQGACPGRGRPVGGPRRDVEHAHHPGRGARARVPAPGRAARAAARLRRRGRHRGGDGVVRELRVLEPCRLSLVAERRARAPQGARGGEPGSSRAQPPERRGASREGHAATSPQATSSGSRRRAAAASDPSETATRQPRLDALGPSGRDVALPTRSRITRVRRPRLPSTGVDGRWTLETENRHSAALGVALVVAALAVLLVLMPGAARAAEQSDPAQPDYPADACDDPNIDCGTADFETDVLTESWDAYERSKGHVPDAMGEGDAPEPRLVRRLPLLRAGPVVLEGRKRSRTSGATAGPRTRPSAGRSRATSEATASTSTAAGEASGRTRTDAWTQGSSTACVPKLICHYKYPLVDIWVHGDGGSGACCVRGVAGSSSWWSGCVVVLVVWFVLAVPGCGSGSTRDRVRLVDAPKRGARSCRPSRRRRSSVHLRGWSGSSSS